MDDSVPSAYRALVAAALCLAAACTNKRGGASSLPAAASAGPAAFLALAPAPSADGGYTVFAALPDGAAATQAWFCVGGEAPACAERFEARPLSESGRYASASTVKLSDGLLLHLHANLASGASLVQSVRIGAVGTTETASAGSQDTETPPRSAPPAGSLGSPMTTSPTPPRPAAMAEPPGGAAVQAIGLLNARRAANGVAAVAADSLLTQRCQAWVQHMVQAKDLALDPRVTHTFERELTAGGGGALTPEEALELWEAAPVHAAALYDRSGFRAAVKAGYAEASGYACLRLCSADAPLRGECS